jgi:uncharacterized membrane protein SirB2
MYESLKLMHIVAATLTIAGFLLRGYWMMRSSTLLDHKVTRVLPHIVDTVFLATGIALILILHLPVLNQPWLLAKLIALVGYVLFGAIALRRGRSRQTRVMAFLLALATFAYIVGAALYKSPASWLVAT